MNLLSRQEKAQSIDVVDGSWKRQLLTDRRSDRLLKKWKEQMDDRKGRKEVTIDEDGRND